ncbi:MAG TPA: response regulator transcription factor [Acidimicrobiales bacterium]
MRILVVDDDAEIRDMLRRLLEADEYQVEAVSTAPDALAAVVREEPDLVLLDVVLDTEDGRDLLKEMRLVCDVPVVFLTGRGSEIDRVSGLKMGADDYIVKPFSPGELTARVASVLRRTKRHVAATPSSSIMDLGDFAIDVSSREVTLHGTQIAFTAKEFDLLVFLAASPRRVFSRQQLLESVWGSSGEWQDEATVTEHIRRVRRKIEEDPDNPKRISTVRGVGYRFEPIQASEWSGQVDRRVTGQ